MLVCRRRTANVGVLPLPPHAGLANLLQSEFELSTGCSPAHGPSAVYKQSFVPYSGKYQLLLSQHHP